MLRKRPRSRPGLYALWVSSLPPTPASLSCAKYPPRERYEVGLIWHQNGRSLENPFANLNRLSRDAIPYNPGGCAVRRAGPILSPVVRAEPRGVRQPHVCRLVARDDRRGECGAAVLRLGRIRLARRGCVPDARRVHVPTQCDSIRGAEQRVGAIWRPRLPVCAEGLLHVGCTDRVPPSGVGRPGVLRRPRPCGNQDDRFVIEAGDGGFHRSFLERVEGRPREFVSSKKEPNSRDVVEVEPFKNTPGAPTQ